MNVVTQEPVSLDTRKELGIFYTPAQLTDVLCNWAVRKPTNFVLEPSFGGCNFLESARAQFRSLGNEDCIGQLAGCDTDSAAFSYLQRSFDLRAVPTQFKQRDFLQVQPDEFPQRFDAVIGNPPYISHHRMPNEQIEHGQELLSAQGYELYKRASLWGYFVLHSLSFLNLGGRVAFVLPSSFLHAKYAKEVRDYLGRGFERSIAIHIGERLFLHEGASEVAVAVLCEGWKGGRFDDGMMRIAYVHRLEDVAQFTSQWQQHLVCGEPFSTRANLALLAPEERSIYQSIIERPECKVFSDFAAVRIGMVTGDNKYFVLNKESVDQKQLPSDSIEFVFAKFGDTQGLELTTHDEKQALESGARCLLFDTSRSDKKNPHVAEYLATYPKEKRLKNSTFSRRLRWDQPNDNKIPDAFFSYMSQFGPQMRLNNIRANCTNAIHRISFSDEVDDTLRKLLTISVLSTLTQLSAEFECRAYGSGVLKHEPSEVKRLKVFIPSDIKRQELETAFRQIDRYVRDGERVKAQEVADRLIFAGIPNHLQMLTVFRRTLNAARVRRIPNYTPDIYTQD